MFEKKPMGTCVANGKLYRGYELRASGWDVWIDGVKQTDDDGEIVDREAYQRFLERRAAYNAKQTEGSEVCETRVWNAIDAGEIEENFEGASDEAIEAYQQSHVDIEIELDEPEY